MCKRDLLVPSGILLILALVLVACGGAASNTPVPTNTVGPTDTPRPTSTPVPTVDTASLTVDDLQATVAALETELEAARTSASGASGEGEESDYDVIIDGIERKLEAAQALMQAAMGEGGEAGEDEMPPAATLTLSGDFEQAREWSWAELEELEILTAIVAGPRDDDSEAEYTGVSLSAFLDAAGVGEEAETLIAIAADDFSAEIDLAAAQNCAECMIVLDDEGVLRLIMPDFPSKNWIVDVVSLEAQ